MITPDDPKAGPRLTHLDGLRGIASLVVLAGHLANVVLPSIINGVPQMSRFRYEWVLAGTPVGILWGGNFAVCIFFVMSALVLAYFYDREGRNFFAVCVRRYIRLAVPVFAASLFAYILWRSGAMYNLDAQKITREGWLKSQYLPPAPDIWRFLIETLYEVFRTGRLPTVPVLWTMKYEIEGSFGVFLLYALVPQVRLRVVVLLVLAAITFNTYYMCFVGGALIYEWTKCDDSVKAHVSGKIGWVLLFAGAYMGAFPFHHADAWFGFMAKLLDVYGWHQIGAIFLVFACVNLRPAMTFLNRPLCRYLGKISFGLYLVHEPLIVSFMSFMIVTLYSAFGSARLAMFVALGLTLPIVFILADLVYRYVDAPATRFSAKAGNFIGQWSSTSPRKPGLAGIGEYVPTRAAEAGQVGNDRSAGKAV